MTFILGSVEQSQVDIQETPETGLPLGHHFPKTADLFFWEMLQIYVYAVVFNEVP